MSDLFDRLDEETARLHGTALAYLRKGAGYSQTALAQLLRVPRKRVVQWETGTIPRLRHGRSELLTWDRLREIAAKLDYDSDAVVRMVEMLCSMRPRNAKGSAGDPLAPSPAEEQRIAETALRARKYARTALRAEKRDQAFAAAAELFSRLRTCPPSARLASLRVAPEFRAHPWALCLVTCKASIRELLREPAAGCEIAELAMAVADHAADLPWQGRLSGIAVGHLGNAWRVVGDLPKADRLLFTVAEGLWVSSPPDPGILDPGALLSLQASLRRSQRRLPESLELVKRALPISHAPGRLLLQKGQILEYMGCYPEALAALDEADRRLTDREPHNDYTLAQNRGVLLCHLRQFTAAAKFAKAALAIAEQLGGSLDLHRSVWLQARVAAGQGRFEDTQSSFELLIREFRSRKLYYDVALLTLELAVLFLDMNRPGAVIELARELPADFAKRGVHREALAAVRLFFEAAQRRRASAELARSIVAYLYRARHDPSLHYELGTR